MPSLAVSTNGDIVVGFSGCSANSYVSAYFAGKLHDGTIVEPVRFYAGKDWCDTSSPSFGVRWGDYSATSLDPDGLTIWTVQEYAETRWEPGGNNNAWGTRIVAIKPF